MTHRRKYSGSADFEVVGLRHCISAAYIESLHKLRVNKLARAFYIFFVFVGGFYHGSFLVAGVRAGGSGHIHIYIHRGYIYIPGIYIYMYMYSDIAHQTIKQNR